MSSSLVRGMPYTTMVYNNTSAMAEDGRTILPTVASPIALGASPIADGENKIKCSAGDSSPTKTLVKKDLELYFGRNDFSWAVFFSEPVWVQCISGDYSEPTFLQVVGRADEESDRPLIIRSALLDDCTNGKNQMTCRQGLGHRLATEPSKEVLSTLLRRHANVYPGRNTSVQYIIDDDEREAQLILNWDAQTMSTPDSATTEKAARRLGEATAADLIMFALPHHLDKLDTSVLPESTLYCTSTLNGPTCLVKGATWTIVEDLPDVDFRAPRPPRPDFIPALASALKDDINYTLPDFFQRGAGDTYFSGKMVAKLGRILLVAEEVGDLCRVNKHRARVDEYAAICSNITLPSKDEFSVALDRLRSGVEIWINGTAETPFVYDVAWGGVVSCGCKFDGGKCENKAPDCPAFEDQGLNFGNGTSTQPHSVLFHTLHLTNLPLSFSTAFYNDQHFHYGYHIYAAAVVAHFDPKWAKEHFEQVLLLVRNIANPSEEDAAFPLFRHKDWYQGSSWASGVPRPPYLNGKNQESTSEAIAAYEAVALYGRAMTSVWKSAGDEEKVAVSNEIRRVGQLMTATELRSTKRYWHVMQKDESKRIYPEIYDANVIGILWSSMAQFGTWFGPAPYLPYGIQLLPLTPISEERDDLAWANEMYYPFSKACSADFQCTGTGWVVLQLAILATVGHSEVAAGRVEQVPSEAYDDGGGNGHSKSNTLWYIATRPEVANPVPLDDSDLRGSDEHRPAPVFKLIDCHSPKLCTDDMLDKSAGQYTCRERISYLIDSMGKSQWAACAQVSGLEYPGACGQCNPNLAEEEGEESTTKNEQPEQCPPCTQTECESDLNRCPVWDRTFVCSAGSNTGGCSGDPWEVDNVQCNACCELTKCHKLRNPEAKKTIKNIVAATCPPCEKSICYGELNQCPIHAAPYLCTAGTGVGGCSQKPWVISDVSACTECCEVTTDC
jgi:hypothetical protein